MIDDPNVVLPMAVSYNERGMPGYTHVSNGEDQRKVNAFYEVAKNPMTGKGTLTFSKRPGVVRRSGGSWGQQSQSVYLIAPNISTAVKFGSVVYPTTIVMDTLNVIGSTHQDSLGVNTTLATITSQGGVSGYTPSFIDTTFLVSAPVYVVQLKNTANPNTSSQKAYYLSGTWQEISDGDFTALVQIGKMEHLDGFALQMDKNNKIFNSDTGSLKSWDAANFISKQIFWDSPMGLARLSNKVLAFGAETVEGFYNAGNTTGSILGRIPQLSRRIGLVSPTFGHYYTIINNKLYFVGNDSGGSKSAGLFVFDGYDFAKLSGPYHDKILSEVAASNSIYSINKVGFSGQKAVSILLTDQNAGGGGQNSTQKWLMYFPDFNEWFEWSSDTFNPINDGENFLSSKTSQKDRLFTFDGSDTWQDQSASYQWLTQFRLPSNGSTKKSMVFYGVDADTDTSANTVDVDVSDDDCQSFYSLQPLDLTWERKINFRGGSYTRRHIRLSKTDARPKRIANFIANVK